MFMVDVGKMKNSPGSSANLNISCSIKAAEYDYHSFTLAEEVVFDGNITNIGGIIAINGRFTAPLGLECDRCGACFKTERELVFAESYALNPPKQEDGDYIVHGFSGSKINIARQILANIFLSLPAKVLCRESCLGICWCCGANLNEERCSCPKD